MTTDDQPKIEPRLLSFEQAKEYLGMATSTLYRLAKNGDIPAFKPKGMRVWMFDREALAQWIKDEIAKRSSEGDRHE